MNEEPIIRANDRNHLEDLIHETLQSQGLRCNLNHIDVSKVTRMNGLFKGSPFNGSIEKWDVSNVLDMTEMFEGSKFNGNISEWTLESLLLADRMFSGSAFNGSVSGWTFGKGFVDHMDPRLKTAVVRREKLIRFSVSGMFAGTSFQGDLSSWTLDNSRASTLLPSNFKGLIPSVLHLKDCTRSYARMFESYADLDVYLERAPIQSAHSDILMIATRKPEWICQDDYIFFKEHQSIGQSLGIHPWALRDRMLNTYTRYKMGTLHDKPMFPVEGLLNYD